MSWFSTLVLPGAFAAATLLPLSTMAAPPGVPIEGVWLTQEATELTIAGCEGGYCGYISRIVVPERLKQQYGDQLTEFDPASYTDVNNKDPRLKGRPIQGLQILSLKATKNPLFYEGEIYNPEDGNVYSGSVEVLDADRIRLKGCVLYVLCQDQVWQRVPQPDPGAEGAAVSAD